MTMVAMALGSRVRGGALGEFFVDVFWAVAEEVVEG